ncbi:MAG: leucine-rich repeat protein [Lachnospiraceae bacterium]|nr:leucine-rich repeat protein [Lachnospiraceae bacterium]
MKNNIKRSQAIIIALALVVNLFTGVSVKAYGEVPQGTGLVLAWDVGWNDNGPVKSTNEDDYRNDFTVGVFDMRTVFIGYSMNDKLDASDAESIRFVDADNDEDVTDKVFFEPYTKRNGQGEEEIPDQGFFTFRFEKCGDYKIVIDDKYAIIRVILPEIAVYSSDTVFNESTMVSNDRITRYPTDRDSVYYIKLLKNEAEECVLNSVEAVQWDEEKQEEVPYGGNNDIKIESTSSGSMFKLTINAGNTDYFDVICNGEIKFDDSHSGHTGERLFFDPKLEGFLISDAWWDNDGNEQNAVFNNQVDRFWRDYNFSMKQDSLASLGIVKNDIVTPITDMDKLTVTYDDGNPVPEGIVEIRDWDYDREGIEKKFADGVYNFRFNACGAYKLKYNTGENVSEININVGLPDVALYSSAEATEESVVGVRDEWTTYEDGKTYYLNVSDNIKNNDWFTGASIEFKGELQQDDIDNWDYSPVAFTIPEGIMFDIWEAVVVRIYKQDGFFDEYRFNLQIDQSGLVVTGTNWDMDDRGTWRDFARDPFEQAEDFRKDEGAAICGGRTLTLGFKTDDGIELLDKNSLPKLKISDEFGNDVSSDVASISMSGYYEWDEEKREDIYHEIEDVFEIRINKTGVYRVIYTDGDETSFVMINADMPEAGIFGTKVATERYIVGSDNATYGDGRRTFYIIPVNEDNDSYKRTLTVVAKSRGNSSDATVKTDMDTGIVTVNIAEDATDDIEVQVFYRTCEEWYHEEDGRWVLDTNPYDPNYRNPNEYEFDKRFWFHPGEEVMSYPEDVQKDIDAAETFTEMVAALPEEDKITAGDEDRVNIIKAEADKLTEVQKELIDTVVFEKFEAVTEALDTAVEAAKKDYYYARPVSDSIIALPEPDKITAADKLYVDSAKASYDALTSEQKSYIDDEVVDKLNKLVEAAKIAEIKEEAETDKKAAVEAANKQAETDKKAAVEAANKQAETDKKAAVEAANKQAETDMAAAIEAAKKAAIPKAGDEIYDKTSKAVYKVVAASDGKSEGTVQYLCPTKKESKVTIPQTITVGEVKYTVVSIGAGAFEGNTKITTVTIPSTVMTIEAGTFKGCKKLKKINLYANNLKSIGKNAFKSIKKNAKFTIYVSDKKAFNNIKKMIKKSKVSKVKYAFKSSKS